MGDARAVGFSFFSGNAALQLRNLPERSRAQAFGFYLVLFDPDSEW